MPAWLRLMRPQQWTKNVLVFAALIFSLRLFDPKALGLSVLAFISLCLASSSLYIINDWIDIERDRLHPEKRNRPIAAVQTSTVLSQSTLTSRTGSLSAPCFSRSSSPYQNAKPR